MYYRRSKMKKYLKQNWPLCLILLLACAASPVIQARANAPLLPITTFSGRWFFLFLPVIAAVIVTAISVRRGRYDVASVVIFEVLLLLCFFVPELASGSGGDKPLYLAIIFMSIPAIEALVLSGIAYAAAGGKRKREA